MKLKDLINVSAWYTRVKIRAWHKENVLLVADCSIGEIINNNSLSEMTLEKEVEFVSIMKDRKGISLCVFIND